MPRLLLLRHAKSAWPAGVPDSDRPLAGRGQKAAPLMGDYVAAQDLVPKRALVSPARRTVETWELASAGWAKRPWHAFEERIYHATADELVAVLRERGEDTPSLMLVGHHPGLPDLAAHLLRREEAARLPAKYPTAALCVIDLPHDWASLAHTTGTLERFVTPKQLGGEED